MASPRISIIIPTYNRNDVLTTTIAHLLAINQEDAEILVIDQTLRHDTETEQQLGEWERAGLIEWCQLKQPSIPHAMNKGAIEATGEILLFLDDDIVPDSQLLGAHNEAHQTRCSDIIAGRVLQPWHEDNHDSDPFTRDTAELKDEFIGANFSIRREKLLALGGFDENFKGAAYRFEREFADRVLAAGGTIWYEPSALIRHLHHQSGGTRSKGDHLTSWNPRHPVGAYYYLFVSPRLRRRAARALARLARSVMSRHHLRKPWYVPVTLTSELLGLSWALWLRFKGAALPFLNSRATD